MKQVVVLSGKGGTGKTTVAAALGHLASEEASIVLLDADVDASNLDLLLSPQLRAEHDFFSSKVAVIDPALCQSCGRCKELCRFDAVLTPKEEEEPYAIDSVACEGCAVCYYHCPAEAVRMEEPQDGLWFRSDTAYGPLVHAHLYAGHENSGKLVAEVRQQAKGIALQGDHEYVIIDGPPGIGCAVIAATTGVDLALMVIEPTVSGIHDLERILGVARHFGVPSLVCINKCDINLETTNEIADYCADLDIEVVGRVPFNTIVTEAMVAGKPITAYGDGLITEELRNVWSRVRDKLADT